MTKLECAAFAAANDEKLPPNVRALIKELWREACKVTQLREALQNLIDRSGHISPLGGQASVKAVRAAGKYVEAVVDAQKLLGINP